MNSEITSPAESNSLKEANKKRGGQPKWYRTYYLLAAFCMFVVLMSLYLSFRLMSIYTTSVAFNQEWNTRLAKCAELSELAAAVDAPGNDVFATEDVEAESAKMHNTLRIFNDRLAELQQDMLEELEETRSGMGKL